MIRSQIKTIILFSILLLFRNPYTIAQHEVIEGLLEQLKETFDEKEKVDILNQLSYEYYAVEIEKNFYYGEKALELAEQINYPKGIARALNNLAIGYSVQKNIPKSAELLQSALEIARELDDAKLLGSTLNSLGIIYSKLGLTERSLSYYLESLDYSAKSEDFKMRSFTYKNLGILYEELGNHKKAATYHNKSSEAAAKGDHHMLKHIPDLNLGLHYTKQKEYKKALEHFQKSLELSSNRYDKVTTLYKIARLYKEQENWKEAEKYIRQCIEIDLQIGNKESLRGSKLLLASILFGQRRYRETLSVLKNIQQESEDKNLYTVFEKDLHELLAETYQELNDHENATMHFQKFIVIQDSIFDLDKLKLIAELEAKYQVQEQEKENAFLKNQQAKNEIILAQRQRTSRYLILFALLISIIAVLLFNAYRNKQSFNKTLQQQVGAKTLALQDANQQLKFANSELERFAYIASHDLKEPIRNITSFSTLLEHKLAEIEDGAQIEEYLSYIKSNAAQMQHLIQEVLAYSRVENNSIEEYKEINLEDLIDEVKREVLAGVEEENLQINVIAPSTPIYTNTAQLFLVLKILMSNGIKYNTSPEKIIEVGYDDKDQNHLFYIEDNGIGIEPEYQKSVFEMFKRLHNQYEYQGSGMGLAICKKIVSNLGGEIWCESEGQGSIFYFTIEKLAIPEHR